MNYEAIKTYDVLNGYGIRVTIFFTGCTHMCKGCFNSEIWDFSKGKPFNESAKQIIFDNLSKPQIKGLSILGGEPLQQDHQEMLNFIKEVKEKFPTKDIWLWSGYYFKELDDEKKEIINLCDYFVDGRFIQDKASKKLLFRGSSNQTIYKKNSNGEWNPLEA